MSSSSLVGAFFSMTLGFSSFNHLPSSKAITPKPNIAFSGTRFEAFFSSDHE